MEANMGSKLYTSPKLYSTMFVIGGCELPLEKNPYATIDVISKESEKLTINQFPHHFPIAVRSPMAYMHHQ
jgi:2-hydroxychromene-2-carboxylate isomerase